MMFEAEKPYCYLIEENIKSLKIYAQRYDCVEVADIVIDNPKFQQCSGSSKPEQHHYGTGGLIQHTKEVVALCINTALHYSNRFREQDDMRKLFLSALFHDIGKIEDYEAIYSGKSEDDIWYGTLHKKKIHHISRSTLIWQEATLQFKEKYEWLNKEFIDEVLHAILAHHGLREWGSPVAPHSNVAWILHLCDGISARMNDWHKKRQI